MKHCKLSRRALLTTSGAFVMGGVALGGCQEGKTGTPRTTHEHSKEDVNYDRNAHKSPLGKGFPPKREHRVTIHNWTDSTAHMRYTHLHPQLVFNTASADKGDASVWVLPRRMIDLDRLLRAQVLWGATRKDAKRISVAEWLKRSETDYLAAAHHGHIVAEICLGEMTPHTEHCVWCVSKSVLATVLAPYLVDGTLDRRAPVTKHVEEFERTGLKGATLGQLLHQTTGVRCRDVILPEELRKLPPATQKEWNFGTPEFRRAGHDYAVASRALGMFPQLPHEHNTGYYDYLLGLVEQERPHGASFSYHDHNSLALQLVLERVTETPYLEHLGKLWRELGAENAPISVIDPIGMSVGNYGLCPCGRDMLRWGQMLCDHGRVGSGDVLPGMSELVEDVLHDPGPRRLSDLWARAFPMPNIGYSNHFWTTSARRGRNPLLLALGWQNNKCIVDTARRTVVVQLGSFCEEAPDKLRKKESLGHVNLAAWSFCEQVLPELVG